MSEKFNCIGCGLCCKTMGTIIKEKHSASGHLRKSIDSFPHEVSEDGICKMLNPETMQCMVYEDRPDLCRIDKMWDEHYQKDPLYKKKDEYTAIVQCACVAIQSQAGWSQEKIKEEWK